MPQSPAFSPDPPRSSPARQTSLFLFPLLALSFLSDSLLAQQPPAPEDLATHFAEPKAHDYRESPPIRIHGDGDHTIEGLVFRPSEGEYAIRIDNHRSGQIVIRDCLFLGKNGHANDGLDPANGGGVLAWQSSNLSIERNHFRFMKGFCVRIMGSKELPASRIRVSGNSMFCLQAEYQEGTVWGWTADGIQFIHVTGDGNSIQDNRCLNLPGKSYLTDFINVYCSSGTRSSPLLVTGNLLIGAGKQGLYNQYGCGIQLNDHPPDEDGGEFLAATDNILVDPGIVGMNINGGFMTTVADNRILMPDSLRTNLARSTPESNPTWAGITLFNYSGGVSRDSDHQILRNSVQFRAGGGTPFINQTKPLRATIEGNHWNAELDWKNLLHQRLAVPGAQAEFLYPGSPLDREISKIVDQPPGDSHLPSATNRNP